MALNLMLTEDEELKPRITVFGVGGAGGNAVNNMIEKQLEGVEFVVANTDAQALAQSLSEKRVQMGPKVTEGLGAGAKPTIGAAAAEETIEDIVDHLMTAHMCFITAGMGGGTGTGAAPIIAQAAREMGILTVGVVTKPFAFEGTKRMRQADAGIEALQKVVDTLIIIPNQNLFRIANEKTTFTEAFALADDVLYQGVKGVTDLMVRPGLINLDFADVRAVMDEMGKAMMGTGEAEGENRAVEAAERAIANPLLDEISLTGAKGVLINITGGHDMTLFELDEAANIIREKVDPDANIIVGSTMDEGMDGKLRVSVVATGIDATEAAAAPVKAPEPAPRSVASDEDRPADSAQGRDVPPRRTVAPAAAPAQHEAPIRTAVTEPRDSQPAPAPAAEQMPRPAYVPQRPATRDLSAGLNSPAGEFTAPRPASRPARATQAEPQADAQPAERPRNVQSAVQAAIQNATGARAQAQIEQPRAAHGGPLRGLGQMINRMGSSQPRQAERPAASTLSERVSERVASNHHRAEDYDDLADPDQARDVTEVPAFLRRQAN